MTKSSDINGICPLCGRDDRWPEQLLIRLEALEHIALSFKNRAEIAERIIKINEVTRDEEVQRCYCTECERKRLDIIKLKEIMSHPGDGRDGGYKGNVEE